MKMTTSIHCLLLSALCVHSVDATIHVTGTNTQPGHSHTPNAVGLYEKFEATYSLDGFSYVNPYDPEEIDVRATFTAPSGKAWQVFGFYDDDKGLSAWKLRFAPNEVGQWSYVIQATDALGTDQSDVHSFAAVASEHHGWVRASVQNPHYLQHDDGTAFYGVGMYTPWGNSVERFDTLERYGANTFAIWNITYGGMVNDHGLIEQRLGHYNQTKCGKIDRLLEVAEARDLKCMFCIWPHDLFSDTVWAHQWHQNPYRALCAVEDIYADETAWTYQAKQYRYLIARFGYSRALGFWEIMNEINGTDGWVAGRRDEALDWVQRVHGYFQENDPFGHPTTASRSGGYREYWPPMYEIVDLPNVHVYESQGWPSTYRGNVLRSSMKNYARGTARLWKDFAKPGIFGEAGYTWVHVEPYTAEYTALYHNAIWASLTNGLAMTPLWWHFSYPITDAELTQMAHLAQFVADIDFVEQSIDHFEASNRKLDLFGMKGPASAFGWMRLTDGLDISHQRYDLVGVLDPDVATYTISYYNPWTGQALDTHVRAHRNNLLRDTVPNMGEAYPDVAFKIAPAEESDVGE